MEERRGSCKDCLEINLLKKDIEIQNEKIEGMIHAVEKITNKLEIVGQTLISVNDSIQYWKKDYDVLCREIQIDMANSKELSAKVERLLIGEVSRSLITNADKQVIDFMKKVESVIDSALFKIGVWGILAFLGLTIFMLFSGIIKM